MSLLEIIIISVGLSLDVFAVDEDRLAVLRLHLRRSVKKDPVYNDIFHAITPFDVGR